MWSPELFPAYEHSSPSPVEACNENVRKYLSEKLNVVVSDAQLCKRLKFPDGDKWHPSPTLSNPSECVKNISAVVDIVHTSSMLTSLSRIYDGCSCTNLVGCYTGRLNGSEGEKFQTRELPGCSLGEEL